VGVFTHAGAEEILGINDRVELARSGRILRRQINEAWMRKGVTLQDPDSTVIESTVRIGADTTIGPFSMLLGRTRVGRGCLIRPHTILEDSLLDDGAAAGPMAVYRNRRVKAGD
jgi:bifunctional UDP-N-acetylglucosamine pyrophosphorylase/glucosamine-1-phosphate N-acetyltransferase